MHEIKGNNFLFHNFTQLVDILLFSCAKYKIKMDLYIYFCLFCHACPHIEALQVMELILKNHIKYSFFVIFKRYKNTIGKMSNFLSSSFDYVLIKVVFNWSRQGVDEGLDLTIGWFTYLGCNAHF
jgi:hypothetical protein